jgi:hypothetical protein
MPIDSDEDRWSHWELPHFELPVLEIMHWPGLRESGETRCYRPEETVMQRAGRTACR